MSGAFMTSNTDHLIRSNIWSGELKEAFLTELQGVNYVKFLPEFTDGDQINIPSIGQAVINDYAEGQAIKYNRFDTGNFTFSIDQYKSAGVAITNKMKQDSMYTNELVSRFVPNMQRALMVAVETKILSVAPAYQTAGNTNTINGAHHRWVAGGTNQVITLADFAKARLALRKANVPMNNLVAIVDPSLEHTINTLTGIVDLTYNPNFQGIVNTGISSGMRYIRNIYGFDVYTSDHLTVNTTDETINSVTAQSGINNLFFSADPSALPFVGLIKQPPVVESEYNKDLQQEEHVVTMRYGFGMYRPENMVVVLTEDHAFA